MAISLSDHANANLVDFKPAATMAESFTADLGSAVLRFNAAYHIFGSNPKRKRDQSIMKLFQEDKASQSLLDKYTRRSVHSTRVDYDGLSQDPEMKIHGFSSDKEIQDNYRAEVKQMLEYTQSVDERKASFSSRAAGLAGSLVGGAADITSLLPGLTGIKAASASVGLIEAIVKGSAASATAMAAGQAVQEPFIHQWHDYAGVDYTIEDSLFNIELAGLTGGTLGAAAVGLSRIIKNVSKNPEVIAKLEEQGLTADEIEAIKTPLTRMRNEVKEAEVMSEENIKVTPTTNSAEAEFEAFLAQDRKARPGIVAKVKKASEPITAKEVVSTLEEEQKTLDKMPKITPKEANPPEVVSESSHRLSPNEIDSIETLPDTAKVLTGFTPEGEPILVHAKTYLKRAEQDRKRAEKIIGCIQNGN